MRKEIKVRLLSAIFLFLFSTYGFSQTNQRFQNVRVKPDKPDAYITFEKITKFTSKVNETYEVVWLRLHNNLKESISFYDYDDSLTPTGKAGIHCTVEKILRYDKSLSRDNSELPLGFPPYDAPTFYELKSRKTFLFGVPRPHFIKGARIKIQIFYPWEVGRELSTNRNPEHYIYFLEAEVANEEK